MNLLLLPTQVAGLRLAKDDPRAVHFKKILRVKNGDEVDLAVRNGSKGKGKITLRSNGEIDLNISWFPQHSADYFPITLLVGISRPQTCRKILDQATSMGVCKFSFFEADKGEPSYRQSSLWKSEEWKHRIENGVSQAFASYVPACHIFDNLDGALSEEKKKLSPNTGIALDNYEAEKPLLASSLAESRSVTLCVGPERGWSERERNLLRKSDYPLFHLGKRVLRVETAVVGALSILASSYW